MTGQLFVISAPSGTGKSTIIAALRERMKHVGYSISHTSRKPREGEVDGIDYHFVDGEVFSQMADAGAFVEWAKVYESFYGTSYAELDKQTASGMDVLLDLDVQGASNIRKLYKDSVLINLLPPSLEVLEKRLRERDSDDEATIKVRMNKAKNMIRSCDWYDFIIINDDLEKAIQEAQAIVISQRCRSSRRIQQIKHLYHI